MIRFTTEHAASAYGVPVAVLEPPYDGDNPNQAYGPGDIFPQVIYDRDVMFREVIGNWIHRIVLGKPAEPVPPISPEQLALAERFLA